MFFRGQISFFFMFSHLPFDRLFCYESSTGGDPCCGRDVKNQLRSVMHPSYPLFDTPLFCRDRLHGHVGLPLQVSEIIPAPI